MKFIFHDGGRAAAGYKGPARDCVTRSISIVTGIPYQDVYADLNRVARCEQGRMRKKTRSQSRTGVYRRSYERYLKRLGWTWIPTMSVGSGCKVHLRSSELPSGPLLVRVSKHLTAVIDHVLYDTHDCSRGGTRCVYGYFAPPKAQYSGKGLPGAKRVEELEPWNNKIADLMNHGLSDGEIADHFLAHEALAFIQAYCHGFRVGTPVFIPADLPPTQTVDSARPQD